MVHGPNASESPYGKVAISIISMWAATATARCKNGHPPPLKWYYSLILWGEYGPCICQLHTHQMMPPNPVCVRVQTVPIISIRNSFIVRARCKYTRDPVIICSLFIAPYFVFESFICNFKRAILPCDTVGGLVCTHKRRAKKKLKINLGPCLELNLPRNSFCVWNRAAHFGRNLANTEFNAAFFLLIFRHCAIAIA